MSVFKFLKLLEIHFVATNNSKSNVVKDIGRYPEEKNRKTKALYKTKNSQEYIILQY